MRSSSYCGDMLRHLRVYTIALYISCFLMKSIWAQEKSPVAPYCRDIDGLDCEDYNEMREIAFNNEREENSDSKLRNICCKLGGGDVIDKDHEIVLRLKNDLQNYGLEVILENMEVQGTPEQQALFWIVKEDPYDFDNAWFEERYALAVMHYRLGGAWRWKSYGYDAYSKNNAYDDHYHQNNENVDNDVDNYHILYSGEQWLSSSFHCEWAFVQCDRDNFVTHLSMPSNIRQNLTSEIYDLHPKTANDIVKLGPEISVLHNLVKLDLRDNFISGSIPSEMSKLRLLRYINLYGNEITSTIPPALFEIEGLEVLSLGRNDISGTISSLIGLLGRLNSLHMGYNTLLSGTLPELDNLVLLEHANLVGTNVEGSISEKICGYKKIATLTVNHDKIICPCEQICLNFTPLCDSQIKSDENPWYKVDQDHTSKIDPKDASVDYVGCDWIELTDPQCSVSKFESNHNYEYPYKSCCNCGSCVDTNPYEGSCAWYEQHATAGCSDYKTEYSLETSLCCWCEGGLAFSDIFPSFSPTITNSPHVSPTCNNFEDWQDDYNYTCLWYETFDEPFCPMYGSAHSANETPAEACCYCGGGIDESRPTTVPTVTSSHIVYETSSPTVSCSNFEDWSDLNGRTCDWYTMNDESCEYWYFSSEDGVFALNACCVCGGGFDDSRPTRTPSITPISESISSKQYLNDLQSCTDFEWEGLFIELENLETRKVTRVDCDWFKDIDSKNCREVFSDDLVFANEACCYCGGGEREENDGGSTTNSEEGRCKDLQISRPLPSKDCAWFGGDPDRCQNEGTNIQFDISGEMKNATDVCCVCGGGTQECIDYPFVDSHPTVPYNCAAYEENSACNDGNGYIKFGHNAKSACCVCDGGYHEKDVLHKQGKGTTPYCYDSYNWNSTEGIDCTLFQNEIGEIDVDMCLQKGHYSSSSGLNATKACCNCHFGYNATGGGYSGDLIGKVLRIHYIDDNEIDYIYSTRNDKEEGKIDEVIIHLFDVFVENHGFSTVNTTLSESAIAKYGNNSYSACLYDLTLSNIDICVGPFWNTSSLTARTSKPIVDPFDIYFISPKYKVPVIVSILSVTRAFSLPAWLLIFFTVLIFGMTIDYVRKPDWSRECLSNSSICSRIGDLLYGSWTLFLGKRPVTPTAKGPEKIALFGFAMFTLFVVTTFTGSITASIINDPPGVKYTSVEDAIQQNATICTPHVFREDFLLEYPEAGDLLIDYAANDTLLVLQNVIEGDLCQTAISSNEAFQSAARMDNDICDELVVLLDEDVLTVEMVLIPTGAKLGTLQDDLIVQMNQFIDQGWFEERMEMLAKPDKCEQDDSLFESESTIGYKKVVFPTAIAFLCSICSLVYFTHLRKEEEKVGFEIVE